MKQLFHTIKLLAYRMRRYPLWIVVVVTAIPLWIAAQWMIESVPWTSSAEVDYAYFQRLNDQLWLKISKFPNARELVWGRNSDDIESDEILIDLGKQSTTRLRKHVSIETKSEPSVLQNGLLAYYVVNETRAFLIVIHRLLKQQWLRYRESRFIERKWLAVSEVLPMPANFGFATS